MIGGRILNKLKIGYALTGSFCTFSKTLKQIEKLVNSGAEVFPIMSYNASSLDTRFGKAEFFKDRLKELTGHDIIKTITEAEPIGPMNMFDLLIVSPCTGNTLAKLANGIYDTPVTLAVKSHLRNQRPVLIGVSTNDALNSSAKNVGILMNYKNYYFIPMKQDDCEKKPFSVVCDFENTYDAVVMALGGKQIQPMIH